MGRMIALVPMFIYTIEALILEFLQLKRGVVVVCRCCTG